MDCGQSPKMRDFDFVFLILANLLLQLNTAITATQSKMKTRKDERQPLLTASQAEPLNDTYDRTPIPRPGKFWIRF